MEIATERKRVKVAQSAWHENKNTLNTRGNNFCCRGENCRRKYYTLAEIDPLGLEGGRDPGWISRVFLCTDRHCITHKETHKEKNISFFFGRASWKNHIFLKGACDAHLQNKERIFSTDRGEKEKDGHCQER